MHCYTNYTLRVCAQELCVPSLYARDLLRLPINSPTLSLTIDLYS